ncbi:hypothetical protein K402DRAFT_387886 [Aulographum hederae CBS 113979]|uniref:Mid2 domain-containing protein n=1 Tax=Aulographum hederae CBS 113979 TaxID=1176131 RepID=A0A6G1HGN6_9PEZI|nr:hypothetical protein K402DRAFT_387886 [Aulographum hederae CBS 113979]
MAAARDSHSISKVSAFVFLLFLFAVSVKSFPIGEDAADSLSQAKHAKWRRAATLANSLLPSSNETHQNATSSSSAFYSLPTSSPVSQESLANADTASLDGDNNNDDDTRVEIIGIAVGAVIGMLAVVVAVLAICYTRRERKRAEEKRGREMAEAEAQTRSLQRRHDIAMLGVSRAARWIWEGRRK